ncbi:hypothetical protein [Salinibius halmophilus]|uniref:hypothetical protein n=1 Tax=Salinibius halmophilus TaxID=1853216 RepID=UPI000E66A67A|nr:hypothetical protein [Salinibius halmophilus]
MDTQAKLEALERAIDDAEAAKREFVKDNPAGTGDKKERAKLYNAVEQARKELRAFKLAHPELMKLR